MRLRELSSGSESWRAALLVPGFGSGDNWSGATAAVQELRAAGFRGNIFQVVWDAGRGPGGAHAAPWLSLVTLVATRGLAWALGAGWLSLLPVLKSLDSAEKRALREGEALAAVIANSTGVEVSLFGHSVGAQLALAAAGLAPRGSVAGVCTFGAFIEPSSQLWRAAASRTRVQHYYSEADSALRWIWRRPGQYRPAGLGPVGLRDVESIDVSREVGADHSGYFRAYRLVVERRQWRSPTLSVW